MKEPIQPGTLVIVGVMNLVPLMTSSQMTDIQWLQLAAIFWHYRGGSYNPTAWSDGSQHRYS